LLSDAIAWRPFWFCGRSCDQREVEVVREEIDCLKAQAASRAADGTFDESRERGLVDAGGLADRVASAAGVQNRRSQLRAQRVL